MLRRTSRVLCAFAGTLLFLQPIHAATLRVSNAAEVKQSARKARPGDVLLMTDGEWRDADMAFEANGTADQPVTLRAQTPGKVTLAGASRLRLSGQHLVVDGLWFKGSPAGREDVIEFRTSTSKTASNCRVTGCVITDFNPPTKREDTKWISLYGTSNRVDHCHFSGKQNSGTTLVVWLGDQPNHHRIDHNHFGPRPNLGENGGETIRVGDSASSMRESRTLVESNLFESCNGEVEIVSNKSCDNVYRYNTFLACEGALTLRHGNRCLVEGNYFLGNKARHTGGVRVIGEDHTVINNLFHGLRGTGSRAAVCFMNGVPDSPLHKYFQVRNALVAFNTFLDCREKIVIGLADERNATLPPVNVTLANNLLVASDPKMPVVQFKSEGADIAWLGNLFHGAPSGVPATDGIRMVDPQLEVRGNGLTMLRPGSPVIGAANGSFPQVVNDIHGRTRPAAKDVGCAQSGTGVAEKGALTHNDVGPDWWPITK